MKKKDLKKEIDMAWQIVELQTSTICNLILQLEATEKARIGKTPVLNMEGNLSFFTPEMPNE